MSIITDFKNILIESLKDNKKLIIGFYALFIIVFIIAWIFASSNVDAIFNSIQSANETAMNTTAPGFDASSALDLFIHNEGGGIVTYIASIFFAIPAIFMILYNAFNIAVIGPILGKFLPGGALQYIAYLIPHGIFEITATVLQSVAGVLLFIFIWRCIKSWRTNETNGLKESYELNKKPLIQSIAIMIIATILLLIAAPIEAYVSYPLSNLIFGV